MGKTIWECALNVGQHEVLACFKYIVSHSFMPNVGDLQFMKSADNLES